MRKPHILVIDSDSKASEDTRFFLQSWAYGVSLATSVEQALARLEEDKPDLILLEVMLPKGTEGFHFIWQLRNHANPAFRTIPVIITSQLHSTTDLRFYPHIGDPHYGPGEYLPIEAFLDKPFSPASLSAEIRKAMATQEKVNITSLTDIV